MGGRNYNLTMGREYKAPTRVRRDAVDLIPALGDGPAGGLGEMFALRLIEISGRDEGRTVELDEGEHR